MTTNSKTHISIHGVGKLPLAVDYKFHDEMMTQLVKLDPGFAALAKEVREALDADQSTKTTADFLEINKKFQELYARNKGNTLFNTVEGNAVSAIYPLVATLDDDLKMSDRDFSFSNVLKKGKQGLRFSKIAILPPVTNSSYIALSTVFDQSSFLAQLMQSGSSIWAKYCNGRATPTSHSWGLFLLSLNLHPYYEIELRKNYQDFSKSELFNAIYPQWDHKEGANNMAALKNIDLRPYNFFPSSYKPHETPLSEYKAEFKKFVTEFYKGKPTEEQCKKIGFDSASELFEYLEKLQSELKKSPSVWSKINKPIIELSSQKAFPHKQLKNYISAFSLYVDDSVEFATKVSSISKIAHYIYIDENRNNNIYPFLRHIAADGDFNVFKEITNIERGTWSRYEKGQRLPQNSVWAQTLLSLDLHPYYQLTPRKNNLEETLEIYQHLHPAVDATDKSGHFIASGTTFEQYKTTL